MKTDSNRLGFLFNLVLGAVVLNELWFLGARLRAKWNRAGRTSR